MQKRFEILSETYVYVFQGGNDHYAFVEFADHMGASASLSALNQRLFLGKVSVG